jgi:hypothetical protein
MSEKQRRDTYERLFIEWCNRVEKVLLRAIGAALALLLVMQLLLQSPWIRERLTRVDRLEGVPYRHTEQTGRSAGNIVLSRPQRN